MSDLKNETGRDVDHEPLYNQQDVDNVLRVLQAEQREAEDARRLLAVAVEAAGGEIAIPYNLWIAGDSVRKLRMWDDPTERKIVIKIIQDEEPDV